ncbi:MAG: hypothetical protein P0Y49_13705 [Candidatus Pedobacter colombiensis]|uniref:Uncharacterized protein n=1 Tax=Candidatus Pedobacter colombiensis TaxID=3121371 RepID=A0AAJ6B5J2_9SPHI|nr:hypothetical protein [Pedobacter sp.]WEK17854.1 MAG: hypothetical protein P0Y49_13705 [Pedobacter sp.]
MKNHILYLMVRVEVKSKFESLCKTILDFETYTIYTFKSTEQVEVLETEILFTESINPFNK